jgi:protein tyrosine phosphatase
MNSIQENPFSNSNNIIQTAYDYFRLKIENKDTFSFYELPTGITKEMLYKELKCMDLTSYYEIVSAEYLWKQYVYIHTSFNNEFGFTQLPNKVISQQKKDLFKFNNNTSSLNYLKYPKQSNKRAHTSRRRSTTIKRSSSKRKRKSYSGISYFVGKAKSTSKSKGKSVTRKQRGGFNGNSQNLQRVITNINRDILPRWHGRYTKFVKIKDINNQKIYLHASSLPMPNNNNFETELAILRSQYCSNLLNFYRFVMDIPKIISLQGCDLDWSFSPSGYIPESCRGVNELTNWNETCSRYNEPTTDTTLTTIPNDETETTEIISDPRSNMMEFYWVDMHPGYFSVYDNLSKIDFTKKINNSVIHCLAGFGRTGVAILLIICVNYYRVNRNRFNSDFFVNSRKPNDFKSSSIVNKLKSLLEDFIEIDTDIPDNLGIHPSSIADIKSNISSFNLSHISNEVFLYNFNDNYGYHISYTDVNVFITRVNYIIYFTTLRNNIKQFPLFSLKSASYFNKNVINSNDTLFEHILNKSKIYSHDDVEKIMNDADILGFDLQELPIVEGFDFELLSELEDTPSSSRCSIS